MQMAKKQNFQPITVQSDVAVDMLKFRQKSVTNSCTTYLHILNHYRVQQALTHNEVKTSV